MTDDLVTVQIGNVGGAFALPAGCRGIVLVHEDGQWRGAYVHADRQVTYKDGRPGAGPHKTLRELNAKAEWVCEELLNAATAHDLESSLTPVRAPLVAQPTSDVVADENFYETPSKLGKTVSR